MAAVPSLSELCAKKMLENPDIEASDKLRVLERLKNLSKARTSALERDASALEARLATKKQIRGPRIDTGRRASQVSQSPRSEARHSPRTGESKASGRGHRKDALDSGQPTPRPAHTEEQEAGEETDDDEEFEREQAHKFKLASEEAKRRRRELKRTFEWKQRFTQLAHKAQVLDRERLALLRMARGELEVETAEFDRLEADLDRKRAAERRDLDNYLDKARWATRRLASTVDEMGAGDAFLRAVKQQMEAAEAAIAATKSSQRAAFEDLLKAEEALSTEIQLANDRIAAEEEQDRAARTASDSASARRRSMAARTSPRVASARGAESKTAGDNDAQDADALRKRIDEIDEEIALRGGTCGGWDERDHAAFLRCVSRLRVPEAMLIHDAKSSPASSPSSAQSPGGGVGLLRKLEHRAGLEIPTKDEPAIQAHTRWYGSYLGLLAEKKRVVQEWKSARRSSAPAPAAHEKEQADPNASQKVKPTKEERKQQELARQQEEEARRQAVAEWRAAKQAERAREEKAREAEERAERERRAALALQRRKEKEQIALFKLEREADRDRQNKMRTVIEQERRESDRVSSTLSLKQRQKRDMELAAQRRSALESKSRSQQDRASRIAQLKAKPAVRPEFEDKLKHRPGGAAALTQPTAAFKSKSLTPEELGEIQERRARTRAHDAAVPSAAGAPLGGRSYGIGVKNLVSGRAMPSWRAGNV